MGFKTQIWISRIWVSQIRIWVSNCPKSAFEVSPKSAFDTNPYMDFKWHVFGRICPNTGWHLFGFGFPKSPYWCHIVWPWSVRVMHTLAPNFFCDATHQVTVFIYKVVMLTALDGNRQHRPLMCSFITRSTADAWSTIFDIFKKKYVLCCPSPSLLTSLTPPKHLPQGGLQSSCRSGRACPLRYDQW